jgi:excisionase family DNA binding protein
MDPMLLTPTEAAYFLRLEEKHVRHLVAHGKLPYRRIGKLLRFLRVELEHWATHQPGIQEGHFIFPVTFGDTRPSSSGDLSPSDVPPPDAAPLVRGPRRHKQAPALVQGSR